MATMAPNKTYEVAKELKEQKETIRKTAEVEVGKGQRGRGVGSF